MRVALQRQNMQAAASGAPIQLRDATLGGYLPGGAAYGAVRDDRQVLVQRGAAGTGANLAGSVNFAGQTLDPLTVGKDVIWVPRGSKPTEIEKRYGINTQGAARPEQAEPNVDPVAPGLQRPDPYGDSAARARESEQRRMMQQYASKEYWDTEQGKAMLSLGQQMSAPQDAKLADYYGAQRAVGIGSMDEILSGLASVDDRYKEGGDLRQWAQANQGLALREYNKRFPGGEAGIGEGELAAPSIDTANSTAGEKALMEAKYALHGDPNAVPDAAPAPPSYVPDDRVLGMNPQGQLTVGEGAYGFDPATDQALTIAQRPVPAEVNRVEAAAAVPVEAQKANELVRKYLPTGRDRVLNKI